MTYAANPFDGTKIYYEVHGNDPALPVMLLLRGLGGNCQGWIPHLPSLTQYARCIVMDHRGAGYSDKPDTPYNNVLYASDIKCVVDACGVERFTLLGVSMGGFISQEYYHQYPDTLEGLILGCTGTGYSDPAYIHSSPEVKYLQEIDRATADPKELMSQLMHAFWHPSYVRAHPNLLEIMLSSSQKIPQPAYAYHRQYDSMFSSPWLSPRLRNIQVPTLVMHGSDDTVVPTANGHVLAKGIPDAELMIIPDTGHMFFIEKIDTFLSVVEKFMRQKIRKDSSHANTGTITSATQQDTLPQIGIDGG
jgi:3-oxoadipate enol-lactonase